MTAPPAFNFEPVSAYPFSETDLLGDPDAPDVHPEILPLLPFIGRWRGRGQGGYPSVEKDFRYGQEIRFSHDGRSFLAYEARSWLIDEDGAAIKPAAREVGWWRPQADGQVEALITHPIGISEIYYGRVDGTKIEIATDAVVGTESAKQVTAGHRLYGIVDGALMYAYDMAAMGQPLQPHLSARLERVRD